MATLTNEVIDVDISRGFRPSQSRQLDNSQLYNFYVDSRQGDGENALYSTAGHERVGTFDYGKKARGLFFSNGINKLVIIFDQRVYIADEKGNHQLLNPTTPLSATDKNVYISENHQNQIAISDGVKLYIYNYINRVFSEANIPQGSVAGMIDFKDDQFLLNDANSSAFYASEFPGNGGGLVWRTEKKAKIDSKTVGIVSFKGMVLVFGENGTEIFYDAGIIPMPFQRSNTTSFEYGCLTRDSIASGYGYVFWIGVNKFSSPELMVSNGSSPKVITDGDISYFLNRIENLDSCESFVYQVNSHIFYQVNFNKDNISLLYDFTENKFSIVTDHKYDIHPLKFVTRFNNTQYALSRNNGYLYKFDVDLASDDGMSVPRFFTTQNYRFGRERISFRKMHIALEQGMQNVPDTSCDPSCRPCKDAQCELLISHDSGITYPIKRVLQLAPRGQRRQLLDFFNLGSDRFWTFKMVFTSPERVMLFGVKLEAVK